MGFFPGHASLAYFFFLGSSGSSGIGWEGISKLEAAVDDEGAERGVGGGAISISGAGLGMEMPSLEVREEE